MALFVVECQLLIKQAATKMPPVFPDHGKLVLDVFVERIDGMGDAMIHATRRLERERSIANQDVSVDPDRRVVLPWHPQEREPFRVTRYHPESEWQVWYLDARPTISSRNPGFVVCEANVVHSTALRDRLQLVLLIRDAGVYENFHSISSCNVLGCLKERLLAAGKSGSFGSSVG